MVIDDGMIFFLDIFGFLMIQQNLRQNLQNLDRNDKRFRQICGISGSLPDQCLVGCMVTEWVRLRDWDIPSGVIFLTVPICKLEFRPCSCMNYPPQTPSKRDDSTPLSHDHHYNGLTHLVKPLQPEIARSFTPKVTMLRLQCRQLYSTWAPNRHHRL